VNPLKNFFANWAGGKVRGFGTTIIVLGLVCAVGGIISLAVCTGPPAAPCSTHGWAFLVWALAPLAAVLFLLGGLIFFVGRTIEKDVKGFQVPKTQIHIDLNRVPAPLKPIFSPPPPKSAFEAGLGQMGDRLSREAQGLLGVQVVSSALPPARAIPPGFVLPSPCPRCRLPVAPGTRACPSCGLPLSW